MERLQQIKDKLICIGENYNSLKPFVWEHLDRIEVIVEEHEKNQSEAIKVLKANELTPVAVAQKLRCSRTTLYNHNQILKRYIEYSAKCLAEHNPLTEAKNSDRKRQMLDEQVSLMEIRDINNEQLKHSCKMLTNTLKGKNAEIQRLQNRVMELSAELQKYKLAEK